jgi:hypothetical protein
MPLRDVRRREPVADRVVVAPQDRGDVRAEGDLRLVGERGQVDQQIGTVGRG